MPGGDWKVSSTVPEWFQQAINETPDLLLFNNAINEVLVIVCDKSMIQFFPKEGDSIYKKTFRASMRDSYRKEMVERIKKLEAVNKNNPSVTSYTYEEINPYSNTEMAWLSKTEVSEHH